MVLSWIPGGCDDSTMSVLTSFVELVRSICGARTFNCFAGVLIN